MAALTVAARARRDWPTSVCALGAVLLAAGLVLAYVMRADASPVAAIAVLLAGNLVVIGGTWWVARRERTPGDLVLPAETPGLPSPAWWAPVAAVGLVDITAGPAVSGWLGILGALLVAGAAIGGGRSLMAPTLEPDRALVRAARRLRLVAPAGGEPAVGALEPVGRSGVRVVAVGADGRWVDVLLRDDGRARMAAALAGLELREQTDPAFSRAFARRPAPSMEEDT